MLTTTHLAAVILLGLLLDLNRDEWFVALTFGVVIDIDHAFAAPRYLGANGWGALLSPTWDDGSGQPWRSLYHEPVGAFIVAPLAVGWRYLAPLLFWGLHVSIDKLQMATLEYSAVVESVFLVAVIGGIVFVTYRRWAILADEPSPRRYISHLSSSVRTWILGEEEVTRERLGST